MPARLSQTIVRQSPIAQPGAEALCDDWHVSFQSALRLNGRLRLLIESVRSAYPLKLLLPILADFHRLRNGHRAGLGIAHLVKAHRRTTMRSCSPISNLAERHF